MKLPYLGIGIRRKLRGIPKCVKVGRHTYGLTPDTFHFEDGEVEIGSYCSFADGVRILQWGDHRTDLASTFPFKGIFHGQKDAISKGKVVVGNDVWVGMNAIILGGVTIGDGAIIGAGSVVTHDVPAYAIHAGNPAKFIRFRCTPEQIGRLLEMRWWDWPDSFIKNHIDDFQLPVDEFIAKFDLPECVKLAYTLSGK